MRSTPKAGGGWPAVRYALKVLSRVGWRRAWRSLRSKNACKTCALGMGGQLGGMRNESGHWPEVCKKSLQAMAADMQAGITPRFFETYSLRDLATLSPRELEACGRIVQPLHAGPGDTHYRPIGWNEALRLISEKLRATDPMRAFFYSSGRSSNEAGFLLQLFARQYGTNHVNNCSYYCHQASGVGLGESLGSGTATVCLDDLEHADLFFLIGANPASNHPRLMRTLMQLRRRGGQVIVVNPIREPGLVNFRVPSDVRSLLFGSPIASLYLQPHAGGDLALMTGLAKAVLARGAIDETFIHSVTDGWNEFRAHLDATTWDQIEVAGGVGRSEIEQAAEVYARARSCVFGWTMGVTHHAHGVQTVQAIVNLALLRGMVGRPHAGLLPIRGHSNVQGIGTVGVTPAMKRAVLQRLESHFNIKAPTHAGYDTLSCVEAAHRGEMDACLCVGGNLFGATPDAAFTAGAFAHLDMVVYVSTTLNTGHAHGLGRHTLILPALARDEEPQQTTQESMFNFVRLSNGGPARHEGPRSETDILASLARLVFGDGGPVDWAALASHRNIRQLLSRIIPGLEPLAEIDETRREFHIPGRLRHEPRFPTPSGKARFQVTSLPDSSNDASTLRLMTLRSEGQFNTVVYEDEDLYRGQDRRNVILMHAKDMRTLGLREDQAVVVTSEAGRLANVRARVFDVRPGNAAMYFPEANVLVPRRRDPRSQTPAYKSVLIRVRAQAEPISDRPVSLGAGFEKRKLRAC